MSDEQRFAEWYVWARRALSSDAAVCLAAAQAALDVLDAGGDANRAAAAARRSIGAPAHVLLTAVPQRRREYAERYHQAALAAGTAARPGVVSGDGRWRWDGVRWHPLATVRPRVPAWWVACTALSVLMFFAGALVVVGFGPAGASHAPGFWVGAALAGLGGAGGVALRVLRPDVLNQAMDAVFEAAFEPLRQQGEVLKAASFVYVGRRWGLLRLVFVGWIVRIFRPQGFLLVTDRRVLLFRTDPLRPRSHRLERVEDLARIHVRSFRTGLVSARLQLDVDGGADLAVTFPTGWKARGLAVAQLFANSER